MKRAFVDTKALLAGIVFGASVISQGVIFIAIKFRADNTAISAYPSADSFFNAALTIIELWDGIISKAPLYFFTILCMMGIP